MEIQSVIVGEPPRTATIEGTGSGTEGVIKMQLVETPVGQPDQMVAYIPIALALFARFGSVFFVTLGGQLGAGAVGAIPVQSWQTAALVSLSSAAVALVLSLGTLFGNLEKRYPIFSQIT